MPRCPLPQCPPLLFGAALSSLVLSGLAISASPEIAGLDNDGPDNQDWTLTDWTLADKKYTLVYGRPAQPQTWAKVKGKADRQQESRCTHYSAGGDGIHTLPASSASTTSAAAAPDNCSYEVCLVELRQGFVLVRLWRHARFCESCANRAAELSDRRLSSVPITMVMRVFVWYSSLILTDYIRLHLFSYSGTCHRICSTGRWNGKHGKCSTQIRLMGKIIIITVVVWLKYMFLLQWLCIPTMMLTTNIMN